MEKAKVEPRHRLKSTVIMLGRDEDYVKKEGGVIRKWIEHGEPWSGWLPGTKRVFEDIAQALADAEEEGCKRVINAMLVTGREPQCPT